MIHVIPQARVSIEPNDRLEPSRKFASSICRLSRSRWPASGYLYVIPGDLQPPSRVASIAIAPEVEDTRATPDRPRRALLPVTRDKRKRYADRRLENSREMSVQAFLYLHRINDIRHFLRKSRSPEKRYKSCDQSRQPVSRDLRLTLFFSLESSTNHSINNPRPLKSLGVFLDKRSIPFRKSVSLMREISLMQFEF